MERPTATLLEVDDRYRALEAKLRLFQENLVVLVDLARQRHTLQLEWAVVLLILFEVGVMIWRDRGARPGAPLTMMTARALVVFARTPTLGQVQDALGGRRRR